MSSSLGSLRAYSAELGGALSDSAGHFSRCARLADEVRGADAAQRSRSAAVAALTAASDDVQQASLNSPPGHPLQDHLAALAAAVRAFACVDTQNPAGTAADATAFTKRSIRAVRNKDGLVHVKWADALEKALADLQKSISSPTSTYASNTAAAPRAGVAKYGSSAVKQVDTTATTNSRYKEAPVSSYNRLNSVSSTSVSSQSSYNGSRASAHARGTTRENSTASTAQSRSSSSALPSHLSDYHNNVSCDAAASFVKAAAAVDANPRTGQVVSQAKAVEGAVRALGDFLTSVATTPKPASTTEIQSMLKAVASEMQTVSAIAEEATPRDSFYNHLTAVAESVGMLGWVLADSKPVSVVSDAEGAGEFYFSKVQMSSKKLSNGADHVAYVNAYRQLTSALKAYIKQHHTMGLRWNLGLVETEGVRSNGAHDDSTDKSVNGQAQGDESFEMDSPSAFRALLDGPLAAYVAAASALGLDMTAQTDAFVAAWKAEEAFLSKAAVSPKPIEPDFSTIADHMNNVSELAQQYPPRGALTNHLTAVGESIPALGWIAADSASAGFVGDQAGAGQFYIDKVKMSAKRTSNPEQHITWAKCLEELFKELKSFVKEYHPNTLQWNTRYGAKVVGGLAASGRRMHANVRSNVNGIGDTGCESAVQDSVSAYKSVIQGPLARYVAASDALGEGLKKQTDAFVAAWKAEESFIAKAAITPKPSEPDFSELAAYMGTVSELANEYPPRGPLSSHLTAVGESVAALGWVAVDSGATGFVGDQAGAGQFYIDKVKMSSKRMDAPQKHQEWAAALEELFSSLKAYVKEYHVNCLQWNTGRATSSGSARPGATGKFAGTARGGAAVAERNSLSAFAEFMAGPVQECTSAGIAVGGGLAAQCRAMLDAFRAEYKMICDAAGRDKPPQSIFEDMIDPIGLHMGDAADAAQGISPRDRDFNLMTAVAESIPALGWIAVDSKPKMFVSEYVDAGAFYTSKALMDARSLPSAEKEKIQIFVRNFKEMYSQLCDYIDAYHRTGLVWNSGLVPPDNVGF